MPNFNKVILAGNMTRDPELRYSPKGTAIAKFGMAINRNWKDEAGESKDEVTFVDVDAFGRQAEVVAQYLKKGQPILVEGRLKLHSWEDKQTNQKKTRLGVVLESFEFLSSRSSASGGGESQGVAEPSRSEPPRARPSAPARPSAAPAPEHSDGPPPEEDDVPF